MQADELMTFGVISIRPDAPIEEAARLMLHYRISGLPVIDDSGKLVGMVTEGDLLPRPGGAAGCDRPRWLEFLLDAAGAAGRRLPELASVRDVMTHPPIAVNESTPVQEIVALMQRHGVKRVPVVSDGKVTGIVSRADLLRSLAKWAEDMPSASDEDRALRQRVLERLAREPKDAWATVNVLVRDGAVELRGATTDASLRARLVAAARTVSGVKSLDDRMVVVGPASGRT
jgi:CBS domain-containing protein